MHKIGAMPASNAATRYLSTRRGRGSGSAAAATISIWSALATMIRSTSSVSSALRRSIVTRGWMRTIRESEPASPEVSPTMSTRSPVTTECLRNSLARDAVTMCSARVPSPTSTV